MITSSNCSMKSRRSASKEWNPCKFADQITSPWPCRWNHVAAARKGEHVGAVSRSEQWARRRECVSSREHWAVRIVKVWAELPTLRLLQDPMVVICLCMVHKEILMHHNFCPIGTYHFNNNTRYMQCSPVFIPQTIFFLFLFIYLL